MEIEYFVCNNEIGIEKNNYTMIKFYTPYGYN